MNKSQLLAMLRQEGAKLAPNLPAIGKDPGQKPGTVEYVNARMAAYNRAAFTKMMEMDPPHDQTAIDRGVFDDFTRLLDAYLDQFAPGNPALKTYVRIVSLYLTFIANMPLHPSDMEMPEISRGVSKAGKPICGGDKSADPALSLCRFCVANPNFPK